MNKAFTTKKDPSGVIIEERDNGDKLSSIEKRLDRMELMIEKQMDQLESLFTIGVDSFDEEYRSLETRGINPEGRLKILGETLELLSRPTTLQLIKEALAFGHKMPGLIAMAVDSADDALQPEDARRGLDVVGEGVGAFLETANEPSERVGPFGLYRRLRDKNTSRAMGFLTSFLSNFGKRLNQE
jgi:uncharacterized protein YjgD (DUF1641 family)